jgi:hypothetical protein
LWALLDNLIQTLPEETLDPRRVMNTSRKYVILSTLAALVTAVAFWGWTHGQTTVQGPAAPPGASGTARYTVVQTEGYNLVVTDNKTNMLYFYTIDQGQEVGSDLKLRGTVDLNLVGKAVLHPTRTKPRE